MKLLDARYQKSIDGSKGGILNLHNVEHGTLGSVTTSAQLIIPKDAFRGVQNNYDCDKQ